MSYVQIADGHDNTAGYARFLVDPWTPIVQPGIQRVSMSLSVSEDGARSTVLRWLPKVPQSVVDDVMSKCGLTSALTNEVTIYLPTNKDRDTWVDYNALAYWDENSEWERKGRPLEVQILFLETV